MEKKALIGRLETKFATGDADAGTMSGYGAVFGNVDSYGDIIAPGAFADSLAEHKAKGTMPLMLLNHAMFDLPIGVWDDMSEDLYGLKVSGHFIDSTTGQDAYKTAKAGAITGLSIGFMVTDFVMKDGNRVITGVRLLEVSLVTLPANDLARVSAVKSQENDMKEFETLRLTIEEQASKLSEIEKLLTKLVDDAAKAIEVKGEEGGDCDDDEDCDDDCECDNGECRCSDDEENAETKYSQVAMAAVVELRDWLNGRLQ